MFGMILQWFASGSNGRVQGIAERFHPSFGILALGVVILERFWHHFLHPHVWFKLTCHRIPDFLMLWGGGMILHSITDLYCNVGEGTGKLPATRIAQQLQVAGKSFNQCCHHALPLLQAWRNWPFKGDHPNIPNELRCQRIIKTAIYIYIYIWNTV